jgi:hypothetical protein
MSAHSLLLNILVPACNAGAYMQLCRSIKAQTAQNVDKLRLWQMPPAS